MIGPNLSDWALKHRSFIVFAMIAIVIAPMLMSFNMTPSSRYDGALNSRFSQLPRRVRIPHGIHGPRLLAYFRYARTTSISSSAPLWRSD